jgi:hypothetical protein
LEWLSTALGCVLGKELHTKRYLFTVLELSVSMEFRSDEYAPLLHDLRLEVFEFFLPLLVVSA